MTETLKSYIRSNELINSEFDKIFKAAKENKDNKMLEFLSKILTPYNLMLEELVKRVDNIK